MWCKNPLSVPPTPLLSLTLNFVPAATSPQLEEKIKLEDGKIRDVTRMQRQTLDDLEAIEQDLQQLQEKCRQIHLVAVAEVDRTEERRGQLVDTLEAAK